jgi:adenylate cyclase, class 2
VVFVGKEIELKILDVDKKEVISRLKKLGAKKPAVLNFKRIIFFIRDDKKAAIWLRLRTDGKTNTITLKEQFGNGLSQTNEFETEVKDFKEAARILCKSFKKSVYEENTRIEYFFNGTQITIDKWPFLPWLVEIEGKSEKQVLDTYKRLKIKGRPVGNINAGKAYAMYGLDFRKIGERNNGKLMRLIK